MSNKNSVGAISLDLNLNKRGFERQMNGITATAKKAGAMIAGAFAIKKLVDFSKKVLDLGSDLAEVQNVVDVTFGSMSKQVDDFAKNAATSFGLSETMAKKYIGTFGAMSKAFGFSEQQAYDMSTALTGLAGDVASFYNISQDEAYTKLKSVFTGETETLKDLGVVMTQSALDAYAMSNGYGKLTAQMSEAEKVSLRFAFVQDQLALANGDFARTADGWANQVRILKLQMESFMATVGQGLINIFTPVIKAINTLMGKLIQLANVFKQFTEAFSGKKGSAEGAAKSAASAVTSVGTASKETAAEAKKATKSLAGFDKLNVLQNKEISTSAAGNTATDTGAEVSTPVSIPVIPEPELSPFTEKVQKLLEPLQNISFDALSASLTRLKEALAPFAEAVGKGLGWFYQNVLVPLSKWTIESFLPKFLDMVSAALSVLSPIIEAFKPLFMWLWEHFLLPIAKWTGGVIASVLETLTGALNKVSGWMQNNQSVIVGITGIVGGFFAAWKVTELMSFIAQSGGVIGAIKNIGKALFGTTLLKIKDKVETMALQLMYAGDFLRSIKTVIVEKGKEMAAWIAATAVKIKDKVALMLSTAATTAHTVATTAATAATTAFSSAMAFLAANPIVLVVAGIAALVAAIVLLVKNWDTVKKKASEVWESIKSVWSNVKTWFAQNVANPILTMTEKVINGMVNGINRGIQALNSVKIDVPDWVPGLGGKKFGFNVHPLNQVQLPRLATGAVIPPNREFAAILGDQKHGTNIEAPIKTIEQAVRNVLAERGTANGGAVTVVLEVDGRELARATAGYNAGESSRRGMRLIDGVI